MELTRPSPSLVLQTPGFHDTLVSQMAAHVHPSVSGPAACMVLAAYRACGCPPDGCSIPIEELSGALTGHFAALLSKSEAALASLETKIAQIQVSCNAAVTLSDLLGKSGDVASQLEAE